MRLVCTFQQYPYVCRALKWQNSNTSPSYFNNLLFHNSGKKNLPTENQTWSTADPTPFKVWWTPSELIRNCCREKWKTAAKIIFLMTTIFILWWLKWWLDLSFIAQHNMQNCLTNFGVAWMSLEIAQKWWGSILLFKITCVFAKKTEREKWGWGGEETWSGKEWEKLKHHVDWNQIFYDKPRRTLDSRKVGEIDHWCLTSHGYVTSCVTTRPVNWENQRVFSFSRNLWN